MTHSFQKWNQGGGGDPGGEVGACLPPGSYMVFEMYLKDGPLRKSSECIAMHS